MWSRAELKYNAKSALRNYFGKGLAVFAIMIAISYFARRVYNTIKSIIDLSRTVKINYDDSIKYYIEHGSYPQSQENALTIQVIAFYVFLLVAYMAYRYFIFKPLQVGAVRFYQKSRGIPTSVSEMFSLFKNAPHIAFTTFLVKLKTLLWTLVFIVPGIIKAYEYYMVPYIIAENPEISTHRAFEISKAMTDGHKWDLFVLELSFILWYLGIVCTCGLLAIYAGPYICATNVEAYYRLKSEAVSKGDVSLDELPDICIPQTAPNFV